ncbi:hypothetical protein K3495_g9948 [Podosphaera aphanis]|nr:hypothetical protein K3495_g9948 [Podosphaera aphanis]
MDWSPLPQQPSMTNGLNSSASESQQRCAGDDHVSRDCPYAKEIKEYGVALRKKYDRRNRNLLELKRPERRKPSKTDVAASIKVDKSKDTRKSKISRNEYVAHEHSDASTQEETDEETSPSGSGSGSGSDSDHLGTQKVKPSKALISKSPPTYWVFDTGAISPMTDKIHLFRGPLNRIRSTTM